MMADAIALGANRIIRALMVIRVRGHIIQLIDDIGIHQV
jgi:hypothetical protein